MKVLFAGGGTLGPVTPLLAVYRKMKQLEPSLEAVWAGTPTGPEREVVNREQIPYSAIPQAKFPRYVSWNLLKFPFDYLRAHRAAEQLIESARPDLVVSVGGYMGVPLIAAASRRDIPCAIHQLDATPGLANRSVAKKCQMVTTTFSYNLPPFGVKVQAEQVATPCRFAGRAWPSKEEAAHRFGLSTARPTLLIMGGGTGALAINELVQKIAPELKKQFQVLHLTGKGKGIERSETSWQTHAFFSEDQMLDAYVLADLVITRAGLGSLSELATFQKPAIVIPMPGSHQEANVFAVKDGVVAFSQTQKNAAQNLLQAVRALAQNTKEQERLGATLQSLLPTDDGRALAARWLGLLKR
jgi:UDP-N-acetylglucosamine--N-acetylmuramyl-(pentapeptide) pyrophosphoryl-undecaprenol N-acetylglucosamine transferase